MAKMDSAQNKIRRMEDALEHLYEKQRSLPGYVFVLLVVFYIISTITVSVSAGIGQPIMIAGQPIPIYSFAGVFSALANACVILLAVFFGRMGFLTALIALLINHLLILVGIFIRHNITSLPGIFVNLMSIMVIIVVYLNNRKLEDYEKKMRDQAVTDALTGLPNSFACTEFINYLIGHGEPFCAVSIDLNGFKSINDTMGFDSGNKVLIEVSERWKAVAESGKTGTQDFLSRLSGDEFSILILGEKSDEVIANTISYYEKALSEQLTIYDCNFYISASYGYASFPQDADCLDALVSHATAAMRAAKRITSGSHVRKFSPELVDNAHSLEMERKIRTALDNDGVFFHLQPQFDMQHKLRGFEALARMLDEDGKFISPGEFIPVAEKAGLIDKVDGAVYRKAAAFAGELMRETGAEFILSINVSVRHLMKNDFLDEVRSLLKESGLSPRRLEIEITESIMIESMEKALDVIDEICRMGIKIAIDDFGTGYSSLSYLNSFPATLLKIDKSFIDVMNSSDSSKQYVAAIISLGHTLGFEVISEGVEEEAQLNTLREIGCDLIQGFIWGRPLPPDEARKVVTGE